MLLKRHSMIFIDKLIHYQGKVYINISTAKCMNKKDTFLRWLLLSWLINGQEVCTEGYLARGLCKDCKDKVPSLQTDQARLISILLNGYIYNGNIERADINNVDRWTFDISRP